MGRRGQGVKVSELNCSKVMACFGLSETEDSLGVFIRDNSTCIRCVNYVYSSGNVGV